MMYYSIEPKDRIYVKSYGFCILLKIWAKIKVKIKVKT